MGSFAKNQKWGGRPPGRGRGKFRPAGRVPFCSHKKEPKMRIGAVPLCTPCGPYCGCGGRPRREETMYAFAPPTGCALSAVGVAAGYAARGSAYMGAGRMAVGTLRCPPLTGNCRARRLVVTPTRRRYGRHSGIPADWRGKGPGNVPARTRRTAVTAHPPKDWQAERKRAGERQRMFSDAAPVNRSMHFSMLPRENGVLRGKTMRAKGF